MILRACCLTFGLLLPLAAHAPHAPAPSSVTTGVASWYGWRHHGRHMANGRRFHALGMTAASRTLPLGCWIVVEVVATGRSARLRVTDRGPYAGGRLVDVSLGAARKLGIVKQGLANVRVKTVSC